LWISGSGLLVFTNEEFGVRQIHVGRHLEVGRGGLVLERTTSEVKSGAVARAQEAALPVIWQRGLRS
jgi:hypothetical protein